MRFKNKTSAAFDKVKYIMDLGVRHDMPNLKNEFYSVAVVPKHMLDVFGIITDEPEFQELVGKYKKITIRSRSILIER